MNGASNGRKTSFNVPSTLLFNLDIFFCVWNWIECGHKINNNRKWLIKSDKKFRAQISHCACVVVHKYIYEATKMKTMTSHSRRRHFLSTPDIRFLRLMCFYELHAMSATICDLLFSSFFLLDVFFSLL